MVASIRTLENEPFARAPAAPPVSLGERLSRGLMFAAMATFYLMSPMMLANLGFHYGGAGGNVLEKIHPGTWLSFCAIGLHIIGSRNPLGAVRDLVSHPALALYMIAWAIVFVFTIVVQK